MKTVPLIEVRCRVCDHVHGDFLKNKLPVSFVCGKCGVGQQPYNQQHVAYTRRRDYPLGFWS